MEGAPNNSWCVGCNRYDETGKKKTCYKPGDVFGFSLEVEQSLGKVYIQMVNFSCDTM